ncbi:endonuclease NucS domain-containing protein [Blastococcus sp. SYSU D00669]
MTAQHTESTAPRGDVEYAKWLWVAHSTDSLAEGAIPADEEGWWTCSPETRSGDLALIYRTAPESAVTWLVRAESDAERLEGDLEFPRSTGFACRYTVVCALPQSIGIAAMRRDEVTSTWGALRTNFRGSAFTVPSAVWDRLLHLGGVDPSGLKNTISRQAQWFARERDLEQHLVDHPELLRKATGLRLKLTARQKRLPGGQIADLYFRGRGGGPVIAELKNGPADRAAVRQLLGYLAVAPTALFGLPRPRGYLIAASLEPMAQKMVDACRDIDFLSLAELGLSAPTTVQGTTPRRRRGKTAPAASDQ